MGNEEKTKTKMILSRETLAEIESLQMPGEPDIVTEIFATFLQSTPARIEKLSLHLQKGDIKALSKEAHALKSSARTIGAIRLGDACHELEHIEDLGLLDRKEELFFQVKDQLGEVFEEIKKIRPELK